MNQSTLAELAGGRLGIEVNHFLTTIIPSPKHLNFLYASSAFIRSFIQKPLSAFINSCTKNQVTLLFVFPGVTQLSSEAPFFDSEEIERNLRDMAKQKDDNIVKKIYTSFCLTNEAFKSTLVSLLSFQKEILTEKSIDFMVAPYSSEAQLRTLYNQGAISQIFGLPLQFSQLLREDESMSVILNIERNLRMTIQEVERQQELSSLKKIENQLLFQTLSLDIGMLQVKESRLSSFAFLCLNYGLLSPRTATLFHSHSLSIEDCPLPVSTFPYQRIAQQTQVAIGVGSRSLINQGFLQQATLFCKNLNKQYPIKLEQNDWPGLRADKPLNLYELIRQFQNGELSERKFQEFKTNTELIASTLNRAHLQSFVLLDYIYFDNSYELLYEKIFLQIESTVSSPFTSLSLIFLELLQAGLLSYQSLHSQNDFVNDYIEGQDNEKCIRFISRIFTIRHSKFRESFYFHTNRVDTDLLKFSSVIFSIKQSLQTVSEAALCNAVGALLHHNINLTEKDFEQLESGNRVFIKDISISPEMGMIMKSLLERQSLDQLEYLQKEDRKVRKKDIISSLKESYEQVWSRVEILFRVVQKHHRLNSELEQLIEKSSKLLREILEPLF